MDKVAEIVGRCCVDKQFRDSLKDSIARNKKCAALEPYKLTKGECKRLKCLLEVIRARGPQFDEMQAAFVDAWKITPCLYNDQDCCDQPPCEDAAEPSS